MVENKVGKLLHGGDLARDGRRRRPGPVSSGILKPAAGLDSRWVGGKVLE
jgi:hypothetical protein